MNTEACCTSETTALDEGECYVTCVNGNHVYNEISLCFGQPAIKYRTLSLVLTGDTLAPESFFIDHSGLRPSESIIAKL